MKREELIRAMLNDQVAGFIWTDERIAPFIQQADAMANVYVVYLIALSVGAIDAADRLARLFPQRHESLDMTKKKSATHGQA